MLKKEWQLLCGDLPQMLSIYRTLSSLFGLGCSTVGTIVIETCQAICDNLLPRYVKIPKGEKLRESIQGFETRWGFPQVGGAIDGSHIPIIKPQDCPSDYFNRKNFYSVIIQGVVDFRGRFIDMYMGWPGKCHDARVFVNSSFYSKGNSNMLFPDWKRRLHGVDVPMIVLGDPAYPLLPWLMKPYIETPTTPDNERHFNYRHSRARMVIENSFGRLKGRWRILLKRMDCSLQNVTITIGACVTLHNLCEMFDDRCDPEWIVQELSEDQILAQRPSLSANTEATQIRDAIKMHLSAGNN